MRWLRGILGAVLLVLGVVWIGQGLNVIPGSFMTGQVIWAIVGAILVAGAIYLFWGLASAGGRDQPS